MDAWKKWYHFNFFLHIFLLPRGFLGPQRCSFPPRPEASVRRERVGGASCAEGPLPAPILKPGMGYGMADVSLGGSLKIDSPASFMSK